jgi:hypothetical protein
MTFGEQLYFGLVLVTFAAFGITLAVVASRTERFLRRKTDAAHHEVPLQKAA